ncbi:MAG: hypothetical protein EOM68_25510 [Spirochaetia bacterium]|nr:hypothetical protein [Spirochaetia bacterium]
MHRNPRVHPSVRFWCRCKSLAVTCIFLVDDVRTMGPCQFFMEALPVELKERVYNSLVVRDRARFCVAMKKTTDNRFIYKCPEKERRLGLFVRSIKKRTVTTPSLPMLQFLGTIDRDDPTLDEISEVFPEAVANHRDSHKPKAMSMADRIRDGSLTEEDVRARMHEDQGGLEHVLCNKPLHTSTT